VTVLSVNVNKVALLRNSRGGDRPDPLAAARTAIAHGARGITVHPRPDQRHVRPDDVLALASMLRREYPGIEFNIEGNPFAPPRDGYPGYLALAEQARPDQCTLVPDGDAQLTSDHGFDVAADGPALLPLVARLQALGARVSLFMDAGAHEQIRRARDIGADRIELHTGPYASACRQDARSAQASLAAFRAAARFATQCGLGVNAGHDLDLANLPAFATIREVAEVSIGHALVADALDMGLGTAVAHYVAILRRAAGAP
jgi:pyridoxine 5-phosphate synthase